MQRLNEHAAAVDKAVPPPSGSEVRRRADGGRSNASPAIRGRTLLLATAAAVGLIGGTAALFLTANSDDTSLEATQATDGEAVDAVEDVESSSTTAAPDDGAIEETADEPPPTTPDGFPDLTPEPVGPADFGTEEVRYLPSADSGFVVSSGSQVLLSDADLTPPAATPVRQQRVTLPASDPSDRRSIVMLATTYADEAAADAVIEAEPTTHGIAGEPIDVDGRSGRWLEQEGFAPFSAGNPMRIIGVARIRLDATTVLDIAATDVPRTEIETLISSIALAADGSLEAPTPPAGFDGVEPIEGRSPISAMTDPSASDYLSMTLAGVNGEQIDLSISAEEVDADVGSAHFETPTGYGWIEFGLFRETIVSFVGPDATFVLANYDGQVPADELVALAESMQLVDDDVWAERLAIAPLFKAPVSGAPVAD